MPPVLGDTAVGATGVDVSALDVTVVSEGDASGTVPPDRGGACLDEQERPTRVASVTVANKAPKLWRAVMMRLGFPRADGRVRGGSIRFGPDDRDAVWAGSTPGLDERPSIDSLIATYEAALRPAHGRRLFRRHNGLCPPYDDAQLQRIRRRNRSRLILRWLHQCCNGPYARLYELVQPWNPRAGAHAPRPASRSAERAAA